MRFWFIVWGDLKRRATRTVLTVLSIAVAFALFGMLSAIRAAFAGGVELAGADRLMTINKVSIIQPLPESHKLRLEAIEGVEAVTFVTWFGGVYKDPKNFFAQLAVEPEAYLRMYPEYRLPREQEAAWLANPKGAIAGRSLANRFGWKVGDRIPLQGTIWRRWDGSSLWEFSLEGIYDGANAATDTNALLFRHKFFNEERAFGHGLVGLYLVRVKDPTRAAEVARLIDKDFVNSEASTKTAPESVHVQSYARQIGDIGAIIRAILGVVLFTILMMTANTMAQSVRERVREMAVLRAIGFSAAQVSWMVVAESLILTGVGGALGLGLAWFVVQQGDPTGGALPRFHLPGTDVLLGVAIMVVLGFVAAGMPAARALRLSLVDALRRS